MTEKVFDLESWKGNLDIMNIEHNSPYALTGLDLYQQEAVMRLSKDTDIDEFQMNRVA